MCGPDTRLTSSVDSHTHTHTRTTLAHTRNQGAAAFEAALSDIIKSGGDLTSSCVRNIIAPAATAGCGRVMAQRSLQDDFDGAVACLSGLVEVCLFVCELEVCMRERFCPFPDRCVVTSTYTPTTHMFRPTRT